MYSTLWCVCIVEQCSMLLRWSVRCWAVHFVFTVICALLSSAVSFYGGLCVVGQCSMLLRWSVRCWAVQFVFTVVCALLSSAVSFYGGLCVVGQCSMFLLWVCLMERGLVIVMSLNWNLRTRNTRTLKLAQICLKPTSHSDYSSPVLAVLTGTHSTSVANVPSVSFQVQSLVASL